MPNVLHVSKIYYPEIFGGVQQAIQNIADGGVDYGYHSKVFALSQKPNSDAFDVGRHQAVTFKQQFFIASTGFSLAAFEPFHKLSQEADIIHYHFPWPFMDILHIFSRIKKPTIVTYHSDIVKQRKLLHLYSPLMHYFLQNIDTIVATSPEYLRSSQVLQRYKKKTTVIPIGISDEEIAVRPDIVETWRLKVGEGFFLFLGALRYYKGLEVLLEAARKTNLRIVIAGTGDQKKVLENRAPNNVIFTGHYSDDDRAALLYLARGFVFPSHLRSEAFGVSLLEAARAHVPLISCEIGTGTTYINQHGVTGLVVPPGDADALVFAMEQLSANPDMARQFGSAARRRFESLFTARQVAEAYSAQYDALLVKSQRK